MPMQDAEMEAWRATYEHVRGLRVRSARRVKGRWKLLHRLSVMALLCGPDFGRMYLSREYWRGDAPPRLLYRVMAFGGKHGETLIKSRLVQLGYRLNHYGVWVKCSEEEL